jgi:hypothetical protein
MIWIPGSKLTMPKTSDPVEKEQLLAEVDDVLRTVPTPDRWNGDHNDETLPWLGRAGAVLERWDQTKGPLIMVAMNEAQTDFWPHTKKGLTTITTLLNQARADLRMDVGQLSVVVQQGQVFDYFDEIRRVIEGARSELFFVDPYLDAEFVGRYLPHVATGVAVRLLAGDKKLATLMPAVELFAKQHGLSVQVRSSQQLHDRYVFVDQAACYLSGASFKDGAKNAPAVLTQITDGFKPLWGTYEGLWAAGKVER